MSVAWGSRLRSFWTNNKHLRTGWLVTAGIMALYAGAIHPHENQRGIARERGTGLAARASVEPIALWHQMRILPQLGVSRDRASGVGGSAAAEYGVQESRLAFVVGITPR